jgi:formylmethanofuran dehydrogenase subunit E
MLDEARRRMLDALAEGLRQKHPGAIIEIVAKCRECGAETVSTPGSPESGAVLCATCCRKRDV